MGRWEPNARERLQVAAMELFEERGYDRTTVEEIAAHAGLTERTFFRYFTDKREVLFSGSKELEALIVGAIAQAPSTVAPLDAVTVALEATAPMFEARRAFARKRHALIEMHAELQERELIKLASLAAAIAESLRGRGVDEAAAGLVAEVGIAVFKHAFERWVAGAKPRDLSHHVRAVLVELRLVMAATGTASPIRPPAKAPRRSPGHRRKPEGG